MAACSFLRARGRRFAFDDDVWAFTVAGLAALRQGCPAARPGADLRRAVERLIADGELERVPRVAARRAAALRLRDARPLEAHLRGFRAAA